MGWDKEHSVDVHYALLQKPQPLLMRGPQLFCVPIVAMQPLQGLLEICLRLLQVLLQMLHLVLQLVHLGVQVCPWGEHGLRGKGWLRRLQGVPRLQGGHRLHWLSHEWQVP